MKHTLIVVILIASCIATTTHAIETPEEAAARIAKLADGDRKPGMEPRETYLLLDQRLISRVDNAELRLGVVKKHPANPLFKDELPWEIDGSHMYLNVLFDPDNKLYKCWYYSHITDWGKHVEPGPLAAEERNGRGNCATLYATSKDGIHWEKPKLKAYLYKGKPTNIVNWRDHGTGVFRDARDPNPEQRYKMFCTGRTPGGRVHVAFSPDGIRWTKLFDTKVSTSADTHNNAFWDPLAEEYVGITRAFSHGKMGYDLTGGIPWVGGFVIGQRVVARSTSKDFLTWSAPEIVFEYGHDKRQVYAMPSFYTHGVFLGLPVVYDNAGAYREDLAKEKGWSRQEVTPELESELKNAGRTDRMWPGLSWSTDTKDWRWVGRRGEALIPLSADRESIEWGCIFAAATPIVLDDEIRIYYSAQQGKHGWNPGHLCLATLRLDGWAGYEPKNDSKSALVETRPIVCNGETLSLAADAEKGSIVVTLKDAKGNTLAESEPVTGSKPYAPVKWEKGFELSAQKRKLIRLRFTINSAKLYSFMCDE